MGTSRAAQIRRERLRRKRESAEASRKAQLRKKGQTATAKALAEWRKGLREEYPKEEYDIQYKPGGVEVSLHPEVAKARWREEVQRQYPRETHMIIWRGDEAEIIQKAHPDVNRRSVMPEAVRMLEPGARQEWLRREQLKRKGEWTPPQFKGVSKRQASMAEYDVPYNVEEHAAKLFGWREEHLTPKEFEKKYGPFSSPLDISPEARITHTKRTAGGFEMKYLEPLAYDPVKPWGVTKEDIRTLMNRGLMTTASFAEKYMKGEWISGKHYSVKEFSSRSGLTFDIPRDSIITAYRHGPKGYEFQFMQKEDWLSLPSYVKEGRKPSFWEVPLTEHFWREMTKPRIKGYGEPDSKIIGGPIGGTYATQVLSFPIMLGEATVGEFEEHILKKPTIRSELMTPEQLAISYGLITAVVAIKYGPKIIKTMYEKVTPSHIRYALSEKAFRLKMKTTTPFFKKVISPTQLRLEHIYHEVMYKTPKKIGVRLFGAQRFGEVQAVLRTPYGTYESFHYAFP